MAEGLEYEARSLLRLLFVAGFPLVLKKIDSWKRIRDEIPTVRECPVPIFRIKSSYWFHARGLEIDKREGRNIFLPSRRMCRNENVRGENKLGRVGSKLSPRHYFSISLQEFHENLIRRGLFRKRSVSLEDGVQGLASDDFILPRSLPTSPTSPTAVSSMKNDLLSRRHRVIFPPRTHSEIFRKFYDEARTFASERCCFWTGLITIVTRQFRRKKWHRFIFGFVLCFVLNAPLFTIWAHACFVAISYRVSVVSIPVLSARLKRVKNREFDVSKLYDSLSRHRYEEWSKFQFLLFFFKWKIIHFFPLWNHGGEII